MHELATIAPAFIEMAHTIVWASVATVDTHDRPRTRILHPLWEWDGTTLTGWIATGPTPVKHAHLSAHPFVSCSYWTATHDTCLADCAITWVLDDEGRTAVWDKFTRAPAPVGYDPAIVPAWDGPTSPTFAALKLDPYRLRVFPGTVLLGQGGDVLSWKA